MYWFKYHRYGPLTWIILIRAGLHSARNVKQTLFRARLVSPLTTVCTGSCLYNSTSPTSREHLWRSWMDIRKKFDFYPPPTKRMIWRDVAIRPPSCRWFSEWHSICSPQARRSRLRPARYIFRITEHRTLVVMWFIFNQQNWRLIPKVDY